MFKDDLSKKTIIINYTALLVLIIFLFSSCDKDSRSYSKDSEKNDFLSSRRIEVPGSDVFLKDFEYKLLNGKKENIRECIIAEAGFLNQNQKKFYRAIRTEKYKLVLNKKYLPDSFYDLTSDPLEQKSIRHDSNRIKQLIDLSEKNGISNDIDFSNKEKQEHTINEELKKQLQMLGYF